MTEKLKIFSGICQIPVAKKKIRGGGNQLKKTGIACLCFSTLYYQAILPIYLPEDFEVMSDPRYESALSILKDMLSILKDY